MLHYRYDGGDWHPDSLTHVSDNLYQATLPAAYCSDTPEFYFSADGSKSGTVYSPADAPASVYTADVGELVLLLFDDFDADNGWTVDGSADEGNWERADPEEVAYDCVTITQPENDHTPDPGTHCYVTGPLAGSSPGAYDVDGGPTRLTSPIFNLAGTNGRVSYYRWFHISTEWDDELVVEISNDGGSSW